MTKKLTAQDLKFSITVTDGIAPDGQGLGRYISGFDPYDPTDPRVAYKRMYLALVTENPGPDKRYLHECKELVADGYPPGGYDVTDADYPFRIKAPCELVVAYLVVCIDDERTILEWNQIPLTAEGNILEVRIPGIEN